MLHSLAERVAWRRAAARSATCQTSHREPSALRSPGRRHLDRGATVRGIACRSPHISRRAWRRYGGVTRLWRAVAVLPQVSERSPRRDKCKAADADTDGE